MKIAFMMIIFLVLYFTGSTQLVVIGSGLDKVQSVGGDFGRIWLNSSHVQKAVPEARDSNSSLWDWGVVPKGKVLTGGSPVDQQNITGTTSTDWLENKTVENSSSQSPNLTARAAKPHPFVISETLKPVHQVDASWNQTSDLSPQPDANGLIHGMPAETYDAIGPALDYF
ncbi:MAG TPA: hypothetical protein VN455_02860 [Methanotrichaceae archaeon]|nr:hypothetical protein [Methanotrichaceae archaeon]